MEDGGQAPRSSVALGLRALKDALGRTPLWLCVTLVPVLPALGIALPWRTWFRAKVAHAYAPGSLLRNLNETFLFDHRADLDQLANFTRTVGAAALLVTTLGYVFAAGGWLQVFLERTEGHSLRRFFYGGVRYFWRFLRVYVLLLLLLQLVGWVLHGTPWELVLERLFGIQKAKLENAPSEWTAVQLTWLRDGLYALALGLLVVWGIYTRTRLALHDTSSALWAGLCTVFTMLRHPIRTLVPMLALLVVQFLVYGAAHAVQAGLQDGLSPESTWRQPAAMLLVSLVALVTGEIVRGARYAAAVRVSREVVRPISRPDPWMHRIGGPGGPQYPLGDDEYAVSF